MRDALSPIPAWALLVAFTSTATHACAQRASAIDASETDTAGGTDATHETDAPGDIDAAADAPAETSIVDAGLPDGAWRSVLFPADWRPAHAGGMPDARGRILPDFSYAGYHRGERHPPFGTGTVVATVDSALGDGVQDATSAIQSAITTACGLGGGVVRLLRGLYRVRLPSDTASEAIRIGCSGVVLRGDGPDATRVLYDDPRRARSKSVIAIRGSGAFVDGSSTMTYALASDAMLPTQTLELVSTTGLAAGAWVVVRNDVTDAFRAEHRMDAASSGEPGLWPIGSFRGIFYPRRIVRVDGTRITLDEPTHYPLLTRDRARAYVLVGFVEESGIESLAIGMVENRTSPISEPGSDDEYTVAGTTAYEVHDARGVTLDRVHDAWLYDVDTFLPAGNASGAHVLSHGIFFAQASFRITVEGCDFGRPQYRGGGGNGYLFHLQGNDALITQSTSTLARHGFTTNQAVTGNVVLRVAARQSRFADDSHRFLAHANLYDNMRLEGDWLQSVNRGTTSSGAGFTGTRNVFWNTIVAANHASARGCAVESAQWGDGYLIGSRAEGTAMARLCPTSFSNNYWSSIDQGAPTDFVEGESEGATLFPESLYEAQRALRCARDGIVCD